MAPRFYPTPGYKPAISLAGRVAVVTGASSGIGEGVAKALVAEGAAVIGTSRTPAAYTGLPYPLLQLDQADPASVDAFVTELLAEAVVVARGGIDVLVLNAGRFVLGSPTPVPPDNAAQLLSGIKLGMATNYYGPVHLTTALLPAVEAAGRVHGYGRIVFNSSPEGARGVFRLGPASGRGLGDWGVGTGGGRPWRGRGASGRLAPRSIRCRAVSPTGYQVGGAEPLSAYMGAYVSSKRALLTYVETLRATLVAARSPATVLAVSPMATNTRLGEGLRPVYTQPVDAAGNAVSSEAFQLYLDLMRTQLAAGLDPAFVARAFVQVLTEAKPPPAIGAGAWDAASRVRGGNDLWGVTSTAENARSPFPFVAPKFAPAALVGAATVADGVAADVKNAVAVAAASIKG
jgi:NAD(P)-dependent dehydrogenase (short-subunit alcohol dehydrogenase family)